MKPLTCFVLSVVLLGAGIPARAEVHALLVGVGEYRFIEKNLRGPVNDVALMARTLATRGITEIEVLADQAVRLPNDVPPPLDPARDAILGSLDAFALRADPDDTVFFYFAGLGASGSIDRDDANEQDLLLPSDASSDDDVDGLIRNALGMRELGQSFQKILDTGAQLVVVMDTCSVSSGTRAEVGPVSVARCMGDRTSPEPDAAVVDPADSLPLVGRFVSLAASQGDQPAFEHPLGNPAVPGNWYGDFTRGLAAAMGGRSELSWAEASAFALDLIQRDAAAVVQTPVAIGSEQDKAVFGRLAPGAPRVLFEAGTLQAGLLSGYSEGAIFELYDTVAESAPVARAVLRDVGADRGVLEIESGELPARGYAVQLRPGLPGPFRVSAPAVRDNEDYAPVIDALAALAASDLPEGLAWNVGNPDAVLILTDGDLALAGRDGVLDPDGPGSTPRMDDDPAGFFERAARAQRLRAALALAQSQATPGHADPPVGLTQTIEWEQGNPAAEGCEDPNAGVGPFNPAQKVGTCDRLWISLSNDAQIDQDVTVLHIDRKFRVSVVWPDPGGTNRIERGSTRDIGLEIRTPDGLPGQEELIVISVPARQGSQETDLSGVADPSLPRAGEDAPPLQQYLETAADPAAAGRTLPFHGAMSPLGVSRTRLYLTPVEP